MVTGPPLSASSPHSVCPALTPPAVSSFQGQLMYAFEHSLKTTAAFF